MKSLVIVESGAKAKKIKGYLDANFPDIDWLVEACVGHVRDLSDKENAVDPDDWSNLNWEFSTKGKKVMNKSQIKNFIMFYERITKNMIKDLSNKANIVINIDKKHRLKNIKFN